MKWITSIRVSHRADYSQPRMSVEQVVADNQRRPSPLLLVACLRIKREGDEVTLLWNVPRHLPVLLTDGPSEVNLFSFVALRNSRNELSKIEFGRCHLLNENLAVVNDDLHLVPDCYMSEVENVLGQPHTLTVPPLLDL